MNVKIDTKEKFSVITPVEPEIPANLTEELEALLRQYLAREVPHLVLNLQAVQELNEAVANKIADIQQEFYENNASFVVCGLQEPVEALFEKLDLLELMNVTPTESEAWDIVQMEEIERELMGDFDEETN
jgi:anti-anti-sigma factor